MRSHSVERLAGTLAPVRRRATRARARRVLFAPVVAAVLVAACGAAPDPAGVATTAASGAAAFRPSGWLDGLGWVNHAPLTAADLSGKVTVVEFWTFGCINCRRSVPGVKQLAADYADARDVVILGIHTPELDFERDAKSVAAAVRENGLPFAVAQDNDYGAWQAFRNRYWPAFYVLDRTGAVAYVHIGELHTGTARYRALVRAIEEARSAKT